MACKKNQHFIPQAYFRIFSANGKSIHVLHFKTGRTILDAAIKHQAADPRFYGDQKAEEMIAEVERPFFGMLQNIAANESLAGLSDDELGFLPSAILFQRARTKVEREQVQSRSNVVLRAAVKARMARYPPENAELSAYLREHADDLSVEPQWPHHVCMFYHLMAGPAIADLGVVLLVNKTRWPFIFGDQPVVLFNSIWKKPGDCGIQAPGLQVFFPVSAKIVLMMWDQKVYRLQRVIGHRINLQLERDIDALNALQLLSGKQTAYFGAAHHEGYVAALWHRLAPSHIENKNCHSEWIARDKTGKAVEKYMFFYEPIVEYDLRLSFIDFDKDQPRPGRPYRDPRVVEQIKKNIADVEAEARRMRQNGNEEELT